MRSAQPGAPRDRWNLVDAPSGTSIPLSYPARERVKSVCGAVALWGAGVLWGVLMLNVGLSRPTTPQSGRPLALALAVFSIPFLVWGFGYWRRVVAQAPELRVDRRDLTITHSVLLRGQLSIPREDVACVAVDEAGGRDGHDELRFPVVSDGRADMALSTQKAWLYSRYSGAPMPILDTREELPNVAIVLKAPTIVEGARLKRHRMLQVNGGQHGLYPSEPALGLLLRVENPPALREAGRVGRSGVTSAA